MKIEIETASNGFILRTIVDGEVDTVDVFQDQGEADESAVQTTAELLRYLNDILGPSTSRHAKARVYVEVKPGDKHFDYIGDEDEVISTQHCKCDLVSTCPRCSE